MFVNNEIYKIYNEIDNERKRNDARTDITSDEAKELMKMFIKNIQENYKKKYLDYFSSATYHHELSELKKYLDDLRKGFRDKESKYDVLYKVIAVYNSDKTDALKLLSINKIININDFSALIGPFTITCINNSIIKKAYEIYQFVNKYRKDVTILMVDNEEFKADIAKFYSLIKNGANALEIKCSRKNFVKKYQYYFNSREYEKKVDWLKLFLIRQKNGQKVVNNLNKMPLLIDIYNSKVCDHEKIYQISKLISPIKLIKLLVPYAVTFYDNDFIKKAMDVYFFVKKHEDEFNLVKNNVLYLEELEDAKKSLLPIKDYAYSVISYYVEDSECLSIHDYIIQLNINVSLFDDCLRVCSLFYNDLYDKFLKVKKEKENIINNNNITVVCDLVNGVKTGYLSDGTKLTPLEFLKRIPFKEKVNYIQENFVTYFCLHLKQFVEEDEISLISDYMINNKVNNLSFEMIDTECKFTYNSIDEVIVTEEIHSYVIKYMQYNDYPMIRGIYSILLKKYIDGELAINEEVKEYKKKVKVILAP